MIQFNEHLDLIFSEFSKPNYAAIMSKAKIHFVDFAGSFDEDNLDIDLKWSQFRDWFLFVYPGDASNNEPSPMQIMASEKFKEDIGLPEDVMSAILSSRLSVFQHIKSYKDQIKVKDLITRIKHYIFDNNVQLILERKDYLQARIYKYHDKYYLGGSLVIHPPLARKYIDSKIKLLKKEKDKTKKPENEMRFLESIFKMHYRAFRFKQVEIQKIYSDQPLFERKTQVNVWIQDLKKMYQANTRKF